jgi:ABC-type nitrate/sulfonate/bicarbonate transport system permease component
MPARRRQRIRALIGVAVAIGIWEIFAAAGVPGRQFLASVPDVATALGRSAGRLARALGGTLETWAIAVVIAVAAAFVLGVLVAAVPLLDDLSEWVIRSSRSIPALALIPIAILLFGLTTTMEAILVVAAGFWPVFVNTVYAVRANRVEYREKARALKMTRVRFYRKVVIPASLPMVASGTRVSISLCMAATIAVELVIGYGGLGGLVLNAQQDSDTALIYAGVVVGGAAGWLLNLLFTAGQRRTLRWAYRAQAGAGPAGGAQR